jgi:hypothetical protein
MITKEQARQIVKNIISGYELPEDDEYIIIEPETIEKEWGWVFFHTSKKWHETSDLKYAVAGNAPLIVLRENGHVLVTGTARSTEHYIERFEETGDPHG